MYRIIYVKYLFKYFPERKIRRDSAQRNISIYIIHHPGSVQLNPLIRSQNLWRPLFIRESAAIQQAMPLTVKTTMPKRGAESRKGVFRLPAHHGFSLRDWLDALRHKKEPRGKKKQSESN